MPKIKLVLFGIRFKYSTQKMINHGHLDKGIVI
jgi:hypothetical protein